MRAIAALVGAGRTKFGELWDYADENLINEAGLSALESVDKGLGRKDIQAAYLGSFLYQTMNKSRNRNPRGGPAILAINLARGCVLKYHWTRLYALSIRFTYCLVHGYFQIQRKTIT